MAAIPRKHFSRYFFGDYELERSEHIPTQEFASRRVELDRNRALGARRRLPEHPLLSGAVSVYGLMVAGSARPTIESLIEHASPGEFFCLCFFETFPTSSHSPQFYCCVAGTIAAGRCVLCWTVRWLLTTRHKRPEVWGRYRRRGALVCPFLLLFFDDRFAKEIHSQPGHLLSLRTRTLSAVRTEEPTARVDRRQATKAVYQVHTRYVYTCSFTCEGEGAVCTWEV